MERMPLNQAFRPWMLTDAIADYTHGVPNLATLAPLFSSCPAPQPLVAKKEAICYNKDAGIDALRVTKGAWWSND